jgi:hypothetical protein
MSNATRGQALVEAVIFLPFMLLLMFAIIYFGQFGILQERAALSVRYASLISNATSSNSGPYSLEQLYHEFHRETNNQVNRGFPGAALSCAASAAGDAVNTLTQSQPLPSGGAGPTAPAYFRPNGSTATTESACTAETLDMASNAPDAASSYLVVQYTHVEADKTQPLFMAPLSGGRTSSHVKAGMSFIRPASPDAIIYCSPNFAAAIANALGAIEPKPNAGPFAGYATPPPGQEHIC